MKSQKKIAQQLVLFVIVLLNFSLAEAKKSKVKIAKNDSAATILKKHGIEQSHLSLQIKNDEDDVVSINAYEKKIPASVSKILTSYAVLKKFPLGFKFHTNVYFDKKNMYLKGGGDPGFVSENMWYLTNELTRSGITEVPGDLVVDDTRFDHIRFDESREDQRVDRAYDSPIGAMSFNWNAVNVFVRPGTAGQAAKVYIDPDNGHFELRNSTKTVAGATKKELVVSISNSEKWISVSGEVQAGAPEKGIFKSINDPELWSGINLKLFLKQRGIEIKGQVRAGKVPAGTDLIVSVESKNLSYILADMNKFSNNFVAEMFTKNLAASENRTNASLKEGVDVIRTELSHIGLTTRDVEVFNPSGFTRHNRVSAQALNKVLLALKNDFTTYPTFLESLPIAGVDGTLKRRMKNTVAQGWVRAKTGYLDGVVSLAGYAGRKDGSVLTFSFLYNGPRDEAIVREAFDQILISSLQ
ncbi:MAG: D-alanyl-D-alanine carboxypeptidase/D-alanyl-D-alanine-endopeptidase [Bdellovibrionaceae bacterium]|nr:D-alanyl-D-alanine carboxypeptidase/D-alanyl-D-alanine-endopeptidase [Bdellovibrio sp.]